MSLLGVWNDAGGGRAYPVAGRRSILIKGGPDIRLCRIKTASAISGKENQSRVGPNLVKDGLYLLYTGSVSDPLFFFTDPDPDPSKSTSNCVKKQKEKNVRILPSGHNQISAVICRQ